MIQTLYQYLLSMSGIIALVGTYMIIIGYTRNGFFENVRLKGIKTEGIVIALNQNPGSFYGGEEGDGFAPVVEFTTINGTHRHVSTIYKNPTPYIVGQKVNIWYYSYKSRREMALEDDAPGDMPQNLFKWGILLCGIGYPLIYLKINQLF